MRYIILLPALLSLLLVGCLHEPVHQGNRLDNNKGNLIHEGDTKFSIEQKLGAPILNSVLHPGRVTYMEQFEEKDTGIMRRRSIEIIYDDALRAKEIHRAGFDKEKQRPEE